MLWSSGHLTGKTTYVSKCIQHACQSLGSDNIIVASFTRTAAAELAGRDLPIAKDQIGTLHAHCYRVLDRPTIAESKVEWWNEEFPQYKLSSAGRVNLDESATETEYSTDADQLYGIMQIYRHKMIDDDAWPVRVRAFYKEWKSWKARCALLDFTDLIEVAYRDVSNAPGFPVMGFFDEVQDFTRVEIELCRKWGREMQYIMMAGDDDQGIYDFKGATCDAFLDPPIDDDHKRILQQSFRVPRAVQSLAEKWISKVRRREEKAYKPRDEEGEVKGIDASFQAVESAVEDALKRINEGKKVMFLSACGYMLDPLKQHLKSEGLPFYNPYRTTRGDWNPIRSGHGTSASDRILAFLKPLMEGQFWNWLDVKHWTDPLNAKQCLIHGAKKMLDGMENEKEASLDELAEIFKEEELINLFFDDVCQGLNWYEKNLLASKLKSMEFPIHVSRKLGPEKLTEEPNIIIGTIHSVKGGQADVVYLFPDLSRAAAEQWTRGGDGKDAIIRQFYVAMTRAKETLIVCEPVSPLAVRII